MKVKWYMDGKGEMILCIFKCVQSIITVTIKASEKYHKVREAWKYRSLSYMASYTYRHSRQISSAD